MIIIVITSRDVSDRNSNRLTLSYHYYFIMRCVVVSE